MSGNFFGSADIKSRVCGSGQAAYVLFSAFRGLLSYVPLVADPACFTFIIAIRLIIS